MMISKHRPSIRQQTVVSMCPAFPINFLATSEKFDNGGMSKTLCAGDASVVSICRGIEEGVTGDVGSCAGSRETRRGSEIWTSDKLLTKIHGTEL